MLLYFGDACMAMCERVGEEQGPAKCWEPFGKEGGEEAEKGKKLAGQN